MSILLSKRRLIADEPKLMLRRKMPIPRGNEGLGPGLTRENSLAQEGD